MEKTNWNSEQWLKKYHNTDNYRAARKEVFLSTKDICENNGYITPEGKEVVIYDPPASVYYGKEITRLPLVNDSETVKVHVLEEDCLLTARRLADKNPLVLNMASRSNPGGGVENGSGAQEECLFRSSNYYRTLYKLRPLAYPMDRNFGACYSPQVTVFRGLEEDGYPLLDEPFITNFVAVSALNRPEITEQGEYTPGEKAGMMNKIRTILNVALIHEYKTLILSAFGCGAFANPPRLVAQCFKEALSEQPYCNAFSDVYFSIKADHNDKEKKNFATFQKILHH